MKINRQKEMKKSFTGIFIVLILSSCSTLQDSQYDTKVIDQYLEWHNAILGSRTKTIIFEDVQKFIDKDAVLIVNDKIIARNNEEFFETYKRMTASGTRTFFILPVTEKFIKENTVILRYDVKLVKEDLSEEIHKIMGYVQLNRVNKIVKFVEIFH